MKKFDKHPGYSAQAKKNHVFLIKMVAAGVEKLKKEFIEKRMRPEAIKQMLVDQAQTAKDVSQSSTFLKNLCNYGSKLSTERVVCYVLKRH